MHSWLFYVKISYFLKIKNFTLLCNSSLFWVVLSSWKHLRRVKRQTNNSWDRRGETFSVFAKKQKSTNHQCCFASLHFCCTFLLFWCRHLAEGQLQKQQKSKKKSIFDKQKSKMAAFLLGRTLRKYCLPIVLNV